MVIDPLSRRLLRKAGRVQVTKGQGPLVLMYHSVSSGVPDSRWSVSVKNFHDQLDLLKAEGWESVCVRELAMSNTFPRPTVVVTFDDGFADNYELAFPLLVEKGMKATWFVVSGHIGKTSGWDDTGVPARRMLNTGQLTEMAAAGMEIGAHTRSHARLPELDAPRMPEEVGGSKKDLEEILGLPVTSFAYPHGLFDKNCIEAVREAGFNVACSTRTGWSGSETDLLQVRRVGVFGHDSLSMFARKLVFADCDVSWKGLAWRLVNSLRGNAGPGNGSY